MLQPTVPSPSLVKAMNEAEVLLRRVAPNPFLIYTRLNCDPQNFFVKELNPLEKQLLSEYISRRSVGIPVERSLKVIGLVTDGLKIVSNALGATINLIVVEPYKKLHNESELVRNFSEWVLKEATETLNWVKSQTPDSVANQWTQLLGIITSAKQSYRSGTRNFAKTLNQRFLVDENLANEAFQNDVPFIFEQALIVFGLKGLGKMQSYLGRGLEDVSKLRRTGAYTYTEEIIGGVGLGRITGRSIRITPQGLKIVKEHIGQVHKMSGEVFKQNLMMIERLEKSLSHQLRLKGADASFYLHEIREAGTVRILMRQERTFEQAQHLAHIEALNYFKVSPYSVYHPDVINSINRSSFPDRAFNFAQDSFWKAWGHEN